MKEKEPKKINGKLFWKCPTCGVLFDESGFYKSKKTKNGLYSQCKKCHITGSIKTRNKENHRKYNNEYMRILRENDPEKVRKYERNRKRRYDNKQKARSELNRAVRCGILKKPDTCSKCNKHKRITAHHGDYSKPLNVVWLCFQCHSDIHTGIHDK